jgi:fatty acid desaturase
MDAGTKERLIQAHRLQWRGYIQWLLSLLVLGGIQALTVWSLIRGPWWIAAVLVVLLGHLMHGQLMALHEAAHGTLVPIRWWNDAVGIFLGTLSFMGLTAYRALHRTHHAYLATRKDEELWPFVRPDCPLRLRRLALFAQLALGIGFMPGLSLRTFLRAGSPMRRRAERRRAWAEYAIMVVVWAGILALVSRTGAWRLFVGVYLAPAVLAGNIQGCREAIEHMGLNGSTRLSSTRSVIPEGPGGRLLALSWLNIEYHGAHHRFGGIPHTRLPRESWLLDPVEPNEQPPFPSYLAPSSTWRSLSDRESGAQWLRHPHRSARPHAIERAARSHHLTGRCWKSGGPAPASVWRST